jgi:hypothetical protein
VLLGAYDHLSFLQTIDDLDAIPAFGAQHYVHTALTTSL